MTLLRGLLRVTPEGAARVLGGRGDSRQCIQEERDSCTSLSDQNGTNTFTEIFTGKGPSFSSFKVQNRI